MGIARGDVDLIGAERLPIGGDAGDAPGGAFKLAREIGHEQGGQMLGDQDRRFDPFGQCAQELEQSGEAAGRCPQCDAAQRAFGHVAQANHLVGLGDPDRRFVAIDPPDAAQAVGEDHAEAAGEIADAGLGQGVGGAEGERPHRRLGAVIGHRRDDQDARALPRADDIGQRLEPACAGHFDVEQDGIDPDGLERVERFFGGPGQGDHLEIAMRLDHARQHGARDLRIIDDHQANGRLGRLMGPPPEGCAMGSHATPTICSLEWIVSRSNGFITYSSAPASIAARIWAMSFSVVQKTTLGWTARSAWRSARRNSIPLITGMFQSRRMTSGMLASQRASASRPSSASSTEKFEHFQDVPGDLADHLAIIDDQTGTHFDPLPWGPRVTLGARSKISLRASCRSCRRPGDQLMWIDEQKELGFGLDHAQRDPVPAGAQRRADRR